MTRIATWIPWWLATALLATSAAAQSSEPPFMADLFPPDLIMRHGREIGVTPEQRGAITDAVAETQSQVLEIQWDMQDAARSLNELVARERVDSEAALAAASRVMEMEGRVKRAHLALLIRIKNTLAAEQQSMLRALRKREAGFTHP